MAIIKTRNEWRDHYGLLEDEMEYVEAVLKTFDGKITAVNDKPWAVINKKFIMIMDYLTRLIGVKK